MSRVFTRGGGRGGSGSGASGGSANPVNTNNSAGAGRSRGSTAATASGAQREWKEDIVDTKETEHRTTNISSVNSNYSPNPPSQSQHPQNQLPGGQNFNQNQQHQGGQQQRQQPRQQQPLYQAKPRGNSEKSRGGSSGEFGSFQHQGQQHGGQNRDREGGRGGGKHGHSAPRDHGRGKRDGGNRGNNPRNDGGSSAGMVGEQQQSQRGFDQHSSRETSSIDTTENDENVMHMPRNMMNDDMRDTHQPHFGNKGNQGIPSNQGRREHKNDGMRSDKRDREREEPLPKNRGGEPNRQGINMHQNVFNEQPFGKSSLDDERDSDSLTGFGTFKNGPMGVGRMLPPHGQMFDDSMNMYSSNKRYFPIGDMGHSDKGMNERFEQSSHDGGDIFSGKDVFWRGPEREEKRDSFLRDDASPTGLGGKSMIWSSQTAGTPIPHPQSESPHFPRPLGFGMEHSAFTTSLLTGTSPSMMEPQHMDSVGMHHSHRLMQQHLPINQFLGGNERIHDRIPAMFGQPPPVPQMMGPIRMGFHPHPQFPEPFMSAPMAREPQVPGRGVLPVNPQQTQVTPQGGPPGGGGFAVAPGVAAALNMGASPSPRSPHAVNQEKNWNWEEQQQSTEVREATPPAPVKEPEEDFGEFKCPVLRGPKNFDSLCAQVEELRTAVQEHLKQLIQNPHRERLRRVMILCFTLWNAIRDAILLDNIQACDKSRELDQVVWREGFYPVLDLLRGLLAKPTPKHDAVGVNEAIKVFLQKALKFYTDLIPKVLHPFGGSVTAQTLVNALTSKAPMADHIVISLQLAERLLTHLGDLYRYQAELPGSDGSELNLAKEAYHKACLLSPFNGQPHSQLALVAKRQNRPLDIAFHSIRAISARLPCNLAQAHLNALWSSVEKTYENKYKNEEKIPLWNELAHSELSKRFHLTFLGIHASLHHNKFISSALNSQGTQFLGMLDAMLNHPLALGFRDILLQMMAINIYRISVLQSDSHHYAFLMDLSFNMFDIILARLLKIFEAAPDLDSAAHLEDTTIFSPVVKVFVDWMQASYQKWFPLPPSQLSAPRDTKRTSMWSRIVSLVNLSLTLNVAGVAEERFPDSTPEKLYEDLYLNGMQHVHPTLCIFYRESKLHEAIAEPRFRFRKMQSLGPVLLSVSPPVARLQWNRFLPTDAYLDKNIKVLWAPLEPPPVQRVEPLPTLESRPPAPLPVQPMPILPLPIERTETVRQWRPTQAPVNDTAEQNWPTLGQATRITSDDRRDRARTSSMNSGDENRTARNGEPGAGASENMRSNVEPWWLIDKRLRNTDSSNQLKLNGVEPTDRRGPIRLEEASKQFYLIDTNCLIDALERIEKKLLDNDDLVILIPATVYRELCKLHERKNAKAWNALSFINDAMEHSKNRIMVITAKADQIPSAQLARREIVSERGSNDDIILRTCITLSEKGLFNEDDRDRRMYSGDGTWRGSLTLLTSDVNMRVKARKENICCRLVADVLGN